VIGKLRASLDPSLAGAQLYVSEHWKHTEDLNYLHLVGNSGGDTGGEEVPE
jgi:hypothetical protein